MAEGEIVLTGGNFYLCLVGGKFILPPAIVVSEIISVWELGCEIDCALVACGE